MAVKRGHLLLPIVLLFFAGLIPAFSLVSGPALLTIDVSPRSQNMTSGGSTVFTINIQAVGLSGTPIRNVSLGVSGVPSGVTATLGSFPVIITNGHGKTTLTVTANINWVPSPFTLKIRGSAVDVNGDPVLNETTVPINVLLQSGQIGGVQPVEQKTVTTITSTITSISTKIFTSTTTVTSTTTAPIQTSTKTIANTTSNTTSITVTGATSTITKEVRESDVWSYSPIGAGIAVAGLAVALAIFKRK